MELKQDEKKQPFEGFLNPKVSKLKDPENNKHDRMKLLGRKILFYMGIPQNRIEEEVTIDYNGKNYRVDLVGHPVIKNNMYSEGFRIAIECGDNKAEKIEALRSTFPLVLILPYHEFDISGQPEIKLIQKMVKDFEQQMVTNYFYLEKLRNIQNEFEHIKSIMFEDTKKEIEAHRKQINSLIKEDSAKINEKLEYIKQDVKNYEQDLEYLKNFKKFCENFASNNSKY